MKDKNKIPFFYLLLYNRIKKRTGNQLVVQHATVMEVIRRNLHANLQTSYLYVIIKEMEDFGLLRRMNKFHLEMTGNGRDLELNNYAGPLLG